MSTAAEQNLSAFYARQATEWRKHADSHRKLALSYLNEGGLDLAIYHRDRAGKLEQYAIEDEAKAKQYNREVL